MTTINRLSIGIALIVFSALPVLSARDGHIAAGGAERRSGGRCRRARRAGGSQRARGGQWRGSFARAGGAALAAARVEQRLQPR